MTLSSSSSESHASSSATQATVIWHDAGPYAQPSSGLPATRSTLLIDAILSDDRTPCLAVRTGPVHTTDSSADTTTARSEQPATDSRALRPIDVPSRRPWLA
jgi:hypothetical protein